MVQVVTTGKSTWRQRAATTGQGLGLGAARCSHRWLATGCRAQAERLCIAVGTRAAGPGRGSDEWGARDDAM
jgi:hypothetical protein